MNKNIKWGEYMRISDLPLVDEALRTFSDDPTADNAAGIVAAVLESRPAAPVVAEGALLDLIATQCKDWPSMANVPQKGLLRLMRAAILAAHPAAPPVVAEGLTDNQIDDIWVDTDRAWRKNPSSGQHHRQFARALAAHPVAGLSVPDCSPAGAGPSKFGSPELQSMIVAHAAAGPMPASEAQTDMAEVMAEVQQARDNWPPFNSAHEGYAVLREEVDELWDHVKTNQKRRDLPAMRKEAKQVAAMALRFMGECCDETTGRK